MNKATLSNINKTFGVQVAEGQPIEIPFSNLEDKRSQTILLSEMKSRAREPQEDCEDVVASWFVHKCFEVGYPVKKNNQQAGNYLDTYERKLENKSSELYNRIAGHHMSNLNLLVLELINMTQNFKSPLAYVACFALLSMAKEGEIEATQEHIESYKKLFDMLLKMHCCKLAHEIYEEIAQEAVEEITHIPLYQRGKQKC